MACTVSTLRAEENSTRIHQHSDTDIIIACHIYTLRDLCPSEVSRWPVAEKGARHRSALIGSEGSLRAFLRSQA